VLTELRARAERWSQPRIEAAITGIMIDVLSDGKRLDEIPTVAEATLTRWPDEPDVQFKLRSAWGRAYTFQDRRAAARPLLEEALAQPHTPYPQERIRCLLAANLCVPGHDLRYAEQARDLARSSPEAPQTDAARALGEYTIAAFHARGAHQAAARALFPAWSETMRVFFGERRRHKIWRDLFPLLSHATTYLTALAREGAAPEATIEGEPFLAPQRGFFLKDYLPEREALYRSGSEGGIAFVLRLYATAAGNREEGRYWAQMAIEESRKAGAAFIQVVSGMDVIADLLTAGRFEDTLETGLLVGRGMVVQEAAGPKTRETFEGFGVDLAAEFGKLTEERRHLGDQFALISGVIPAAIEIARLSLVDSPKATAATRRTAAICQQLAADEHGDAAMWRTAADLFELSCGDGTHLAHMLDYINKITGEGDTQTALKILGYLLLTPHATPSQVISYHLGIIERLQRWLLRHESVNTQILTPYVVAYWLHAARTQRFAFGTPVVAIPAIEEAANAPESQRIYAILSAASLGFRIQGAGVLTLHAVCIYVTA
jgi:hypothetical protein